MNEQLVLIAIGLVAAAFILRPLLRGRRSSTRVAGPESTLPASAASEELAELELDRAMGRIGEEDYARWRRELDSKAALPGDGPVPVPAIPVATDDATARAESLVRQWREAPRPSCPRCGERPEAGARYCSSCGTSLAS